MQDTKNYTGNLKIKNIDELEQLIDNTSGEKDFHNLNEKPEDKTENQNNKNEVENQTIFHLAEKYLSSRYELRFNTILLDIEIKKKSNDVWKICNEDSLYIEMQKKGINIPINKLISILKSDFVPKYNPIKNYFKNLKKWDYKKDYIDHLTTFISTPNRENFSYHLKKWLVRSVKCMLIEGYFNKQAFIITDKGKGQNIGKSHLTKWLCPPGLPSSRSFEDSKKDNLVKLTKNAFIILDELDGISRKDLNSLKSMFSLDETRVRLPYAKREETIQRISNFIGSTNDDTFLNDPTGSVRWLIFEVNKIDWNYSKAIDINDIWSQAYTLSKDKNFNEKFTEKDVKENEIRNQEYQIRTPESELINRYFKRPSEKSIENAEFLTSTEVLQYLNRNSDKLRLNNISVGKALTQLGFERVKKNGSYGYLLCYSNTP